MTLNTDLLMENEDWLVLRTLEYAKRHGFTKYTSTLEEAWRISISGITASLVAGVSKFHDVPELDPDDSGALDPLTEFGVVEAGRHRTRGVSIGMFLGLLKYYRQSYLDLIGQKGAPASLREENQLFINRCFDRIEIAFCREWTETGSDDQMSELQQTARRMTNEKNAYLTVFESLSDPVIILDTEDRVINLNNAASLLTAPQHIPGGQYYRAAPLTDGSTPYGKHTVDELCLGKDVTTLFPSLESTLKQLKENHGTPCETELVVPEGTKFFEVKRSLLLDVSEKLTGAIIIFRDITKRKHSEDALQHTVADLEVALSEVKRLTGLLPICADCKKVRDDKGYWFQVEQYISERSEARFSHGICPECFHKHYPELEDASDEPPPGHRRFSHSAP